MRRRSFFAAPLLLPALARANDLPLVGVLSSNARTIDYFTDTFPRQLARLGWEEGKTYHLQLLSADGDVARLPALALDLLRHQPRLIVGIGNEGVRAAQSATQDLPIVGLANDMVAGGLVPSMARTRGNTTGVSIMAHELDVKRLELLHTAAPRATGSHYSSIRPVEPGVLSLTWNKRRSSSDSRRCLSARRLETNCRARCKPYRMRGLRPSQFWRPPSSMPHAT